MIVTCDELAKRNLTELRKTVNHWEADGMYRGPGLGIAALTSDMDAPYIKYLTKDANDLGILVFSSFAPNIDTLMEDIKSFNKNQNVHGIIVHHDSKGLINESGADNIVDWQKDIDGNTFIQRGLMATTYPGNMYKYCRLPATANAALKLAWFYNEGKRVSIFGRGPVGKACANIFNSSGYTVMHFSSAMQDLRFACDFSDVIILAQSPGKTYKFDANCLRMAKDLLIIDIGGNLDDDSGLIDMAANVKYVPKIGKMTRAMLLDNLVTNWCAYEYKIPSLKTEEIK